MKAGRKPRAVPAKKVTFYISVPTVAEVELLLTDPTRQRYTVKYGAWSQLVEALLNEWLEKQRNASLENPAVEESQP